MKFLNFLFFLFNLIFLNSNCEELSDQTNNEPSLKLNDNLEKSKSQNLIIESRLNTNPKSQNLNEIINGNIKQDPKKLNNNDLLKKVNKKNQYKVDFDSNLKDISFKY